MARPRPVTIAYSNSAFDQWRLSQSGGTIFMHQTKGPMFRFPSFEHYQKYLALWSKKDEYEDVYDTNYLYTVAEEMKK